MGEKGTRCEGCGELVLRVAVLEALALAARGRTIEPNAVYTIDEAATLLRCSPKTVQRMINGKHLAATRLGTRKGVRISGSALASFVRARTDNIPLQERGHPPTPTASPFRRINHRGKRS